MIVRHSSARNGRLVMLALCTNVRAAPDNSVLQRATLSRHVIRFALECPISDWIGDLLDADDRAEDIMGAT